MKAAVPLFLLLSMESGSNVRPEAVSPVSILIPHPDKDAAPVEATGIEGLIRGAAHLCGVPVSILRELIRVESNFDPNAVSHKGAVGLGQLMPATVRFMGVKDPKDPWSNAVGSACFLSHLKTTTWRDALMQYFAGNLPKGREASTYADTILQGNDQ